MRPLNEKTEKLLQDYFANRPEIILAYLFGSLAEGRTHKLSDVDTQKLREIQDLYLYERLNERQFSKIGVR